MPFGVKNVGETYQQSINLIFHDFIDNFIEVYIHDMVITLKKKIDGHLNNLRISFQKNEKT